MTTAELEDWLLAKVAAELGVPPESLEIDAPFASLCLDSLQMVGISVELQNLLGQELDPVVIWEFPTIAKLAAYLVALPGVATLEPTKTPTSGDAGVGRSMRFSLFFFSADETKNSGYDFVLKTAKAADDLGFEAVWLPERHFHAVGGLFPNPAVAAAAIAAQTQRLAIRAGAVVAPLHDPVRVAEEWAMVDRLSGGRVGLAIASGWHADDFVFRPEAYAQRKEAALEELRKIRALWRGEALARMNGAGKAISVVTRPRPLQAELPVWLAALGSQDTFEAAGAAGANLLTALLSQSLEELTANIAVYRAARRQAGHVGPGTVTLMLHAFIGEDREAVKQQVRAPFQRYIAGALELIGPLASALGASLDLATLDPADREALLDHAFERWWDGKALLGSEVDARRMVARLAAVGVDEIGCLVDWGLPLDDVLVSLGRIAALQQAPPVAGGAP